MEGSRAPRDVRGPSEEHGRRGPGRLHVRDEDRLQSLPAEGHRKGIRVHHRKLPRGEVPAKDEDHRGNESRSQRGPGPPHRAGCRGRRSDRGQHRAGHADPRIRPSNLPGWNLHHQEGRGGVRTADEKEPKADAKTAKKAKKTAVPEVPEPELALPTTTEIHAAKKDERIDWCERYGLSQEGKDDDLRKRLHTFIEKEAAKKAEPEEDKPAPSKAEKKAKEKPKEKAKPSKAKKGKEAEEEAEEEVHEPRAKPKLEPHLKRLLAL